MSKQDIETVKATLTPLKKQLQEREEKQQAERVLKNNELLVSYFKDIPEIKFEDRNGKCVVLVNGATFYYNYEYHHRGYEFASTHKILTRKWWGKKCVKETKVAFSSFWTEESVKQILEKHLEALEWEVANG